MINSNFTQTARKIFLTNKNWNKIFCIGYNKTGTTTLEGVLKLYGLKLPNQQEQELRLTKQCFSCNYTPLIEFASKYEAFQDLPFSQGEVYVACDALFPNSKFILTERDSEAWYNSMVNFHKKIFNISNIDSLTEIDIIEKYNYLYPGYFHENKKRLLTNFHGKVATVHWELLYNKDYYISTYEERNNRIKKYFQNCPEKLLVVDITTTQDTKEILEFFKIPEEFNIPMPKLNQT